MPKMEKSPPELIERFDTVAADFPEATRRLTFGYPCLYVGGNMVSGLFESSWHVKLGPDERRELEAIPGSAPFEPIPGRPMTGFTLLPSSIINDDQAIRHWVQRAIDYGATLPPKVPELRVGSPAKRFVGGEGCDVRHGGIVRAKSPGVAAPGLDAPYLTFE